MDLGSLVIFLSFLYYNKAALDFTLCFGVASVFSSFYHKEAKYFHIQTLLRDIYFYMLSLIYIVFICWDFKVTVYEAAILVSLYPGYLAFTFYSNNDKEKSFTLENDNTVNTSTIKQSLPWTRYKIKLIL